MLAIVTFLSSLVVTLVVLVVVRSFLGFYYYFLMYGYQRVRVAGSR